VSPNLNDGEETLILPLPMYHVFALTGALSFFNKGAQAVLIANPRDMPAFLKVLVGTRFTAIIGVNTLFRSLLDAPGFAAVDLRPLKLAVAGGMAVQQVVAHRWKERAGVPLVEGYGLTESAPVAIANPVTVQEWSGQIGVPLPSTEAVILDDNGSPYTSTIVLVVRQGNPKGIKDWDDLIKPGVSVITPNPKTSGGARWNYLAAWEFAKRKLGSDAKAKDFVQALYKNVPVLDSGARGSSITFAQRNQGDVFISWENEAHLLEKEFGGKVDIVYPSLSILAEPPVTVVDKNVDKKGTRAVATAYLEYLYSEEGQDIAGKNFYRPISEKFQTKYVKQLPKITLFTIDEAFGGWTKAANEHFVDGGYFDQIYTNK